MRREARKQNITIGIIALLLIVTIGYATLQTNLTINGTSKINNSTWNVHFNNPSAATAGSVAIDTTAYAAAKAATKDSATQVSFNVLLTNPGDFYEFTVPVENEDTIFCNDRSIKSLGAWNPTANSKTGYLQFKQYSVTSDLSCTNITDKFSHANTTYAYLKYPIGLATSAEMNLLGNAGMRKTGSIYWLASPRYFSSINVSGRNVGSDGSFDSSNVSNGYGVRPVVSLAPGTTYSGGDGSEDTPYEVGPQS